jgi:hypothetical protein
VRVCKCPGCGQIIVDDPRWRPSGFKWGVDFCDFEDFKDMMPQLAEKLKPGGWVEDELYLYRRSKTNKVYRMAKMEYTKESFMLHGLTESATHKNPWPKNYHYEILRKQGRKKLDEFAGNNNELEVVS